MIYYYNTFHIGTRRSENCIALQNNSLYLPIYIYTTYIVGTYIIAPSGFHLLGIINTEYSNKNAKSEIDNST